jgi:hypothetical protein
VAMTTHDFHLTALARAHRTDLVAEADRSRLAALVRPARRPAPLAQSAERLHGKEKVYGSIP